MMTIKKVETRKDQKAFIMLPFELYKDNSYWIPPIIKDEYKIFSKATNPAMDFCDSCFWIAEENGKTIGRIAAIINHRYNEKVSEKLGRFSRLESINDGDVIGALLHTAEDWLREKGMTKVHGPLGFTNLDLQGLLVEGFDHLPSIASVYHHPYYQTHIEKNGYEKENDWLEFRLKLEDHIPEKATRMVDLIKKRFNLRVISFKSKKEMLPYANKLFTLLNSAFEELPYVSAFDEITKEFYIKKYFSFLNPEFVKVVVDEHNELRAFIVGLPSLSRAMQKCNGKLFPFRFRHILHALKHPTEMDLLLTGVDPALQSQGVAAVLIFELQQVLLKYKVPFVETTGIFESNNKAITTWKNYEHIQHKRRRCFVKNL
ncbi:MAG: N-acetyltransferase [Bacteroidales bacterium]